MSLKLPKYELYEEGSQIRRSSKGICSCIVEGYGRKRYKSDFIRYLVYAQASCDETQLHLNFIFSSKYIEEADFRDILEKYKELGRKIYKFIQYVEEEWK